MNKKLLIIIIAVVVVIATVAIIVFGGNGNTPDLSGNSANSSSSSLIDEEADPDRFQLYVSNYDGGFGGAWLEQIKIRYEKQHENDVYETAEGTKTGVQIMINPIKEKAGALVDSVLGGPNDVFFTEFAYYYELYEHGILGDITEAVTGDLSVYNQGDAEGTTIKSKLTEQQEQYYNIEGKYYGIPHYAGFNGLIYNKRLFDQRCWYFALNPRGNTLEGKFIQSLSETKSKGPDGVLNTYDDGLPATYDEFFQLCEWIEGVNNIPVILNGIGYQSYVTSLINALAVNHNGLQESLLNYTFNGTSSKLVKVLENGTIVPDANPTAISLDNGYELARQAGKAHALTFAKRLLTENQSAYLNENFDSTSFTHLMAQSQFIRSEYEGPAAMLLDGIWWQSEATSEFDDASWEFGEGFSKQDSEFLWMPLPHATSEQIGQNTTLYDSIYSMCFMKGNLTGVKREVAIDFIKFCNTQESLVEFTAITDTPKALNYSLNSDQLNVLTPFAKSLFKVLNDPTTQILYPYANNDFYKVNQRMVCESLCARLDGLDYLHPAELFINPDNQKSVYDYFSGMYTRRSTDWETWRSNVIG